jgi:hypothetical protein
MVKYLGRYCLRGAVDQDVYDVVTELFDVMRDLLKNDITISEIPAIRVRAIEALVEFEDVIPKTEHAMIVHLLLHICDMMERWGPVRSVWMFPYERFIGFLSRCIKNRRYPEASLISFWTIYTNRFYLSPTEARSMFDHMKRLPDDVIPVDKNNPVRCNKKHMRTRNLTEKEKELVHHGMSMRGGCKAYDDLIQKIGQDKDSKQTTFDDYIKHGAENKLSKEECAIGLGVRNDICT